MGKHVYESKTPNSEGIVDWTATENETWEKLITRQSEVIKGRAAASFFTGLEKLDFPRNRVPQIPELNKILNAETGFGVYPVPALIQPQEFFELLSKSLFPMATFIRIPEELDYIEEPDVFHEVYGHTPMLTDKDITTFIREFGKLALSVDRKYRRKLFRLFWFTIEFGMIKEKEETKAYGAGILSSIGETQYCLSGQCERVEFDLLEVFRTPYRIDIMQPLYFVLNSMDDLFKVFDVNIEKLIQESIDLGDLPPKFEPKGKTLDTDTGVMGN